MNSQTSLFWRTLFVSLLLAGGCASEEEPADALPELEFTEDADAADAAPFCTPGEPLGCAKEGDQGIGLVCNEAGTEAVELPCIGTADEPTPCTEGVCWECTPGARTCLDGNAVAQCTEEGKNEVVQVCSDVQEGLVCSSGNCFRLCELNQKFNSYIGCEYWAVDLDNAYVEGGGGAIFDAAGSQFSIVIGNPNEDYPALVEVFVLEEGVEVPLTLSSAGTPLDLSPIEPGTLRVLNVPRRDIDGSGIFAKAFRLESSVPVTATQFNPLDNTIEVYSNDASLLLPSDVLGTFHVAMTREQTFPDLRSYITVVGTRDGTNVSVTTPVGTLASGGLDPMIPGESQVFTLNRYDVLNLETDAPGDDLTGSIILSSEPVAVFGGSEAANAPNTATCLEEGVCAYDESKPCTTLLDCLPFNTCCADHLEQQLFPVHTWGQNFVATKSKARGEEKDIWRIIAAQDDTVIETIPSQGLLPVLDRGEFVEFETAEDFRLVASNPVMVGQFLAAEDAPEPNLNGVTPGQDGQPGDAGIGDPAFILLVPVEQYRDAYVVFVPEGYDEDYANIIAPFDADVTHNGEVIPPDAFEPVSADYRVARLRLEDGHHVFQADPIFGVIVYGFDDYVSYGYPGGLDLKDLGLVNQRFEK